MSTFEQFQAGVRAGFRLHCEADLYWRTNRWEPDDDYLYVNEYPTKEDAAIVLMKRGFVWSEIAKLWTKSDQYAVIKQVGDRWEIDSWWAE